MHSPETRSQFIHLRAGGLSFARIGRQLGVSKPTLIAWSKVVRSESPNGPDPAGESDNDPATIAREELADLKKRQTALRQELLSRLLKDVSTEALEKLAGEIHQRIEKLEPTMQSFSPETVSTNSEI